MTITLADLDDPEVQALIALHQQAMRQGSPPGHSFALDLSGLHDPAVTVWTAREAERVAGIGALKRHGGGQA